VPLEENITYHVAAFSGNADLSLQIFILVIALTQLRQLRSSPRANITPS
jgi:hypothetical protein